MKCALFFRVAGPRYPIKATMNHRRLRGRAARGATVAALLVALISPILNVETAGATTAATKKSAPAKKTAAAKKVTSPLPAMTVTDVKTGKPVALATTFDGTKPMLVWFWAPH